MNIYDFLIELSDNEIQRKTVAPLVKDDIGNTEIAGTSIIAQYLYQFVDNQELLDIKMNWIYNCLSDFLEAGIWLKFSQAGLDVIDKIDEEDGIVPKVVVV